MHSLLDLKLADTIHRDRAARAAAYGQRPARPTRAQRKTRRRKD
jgi:hypothetical protein